MIQIVNLYILIDMLLDSFIARVDLADIVALCKIGYRKISNIRHTESQNLNDSSLVLQLSLPNLLKPGVKSRMKMM